MIRLAADENFDRDILRGLRRRAPDLDVIHVQDAGLAQAKDPDVLAWAAAEGRILLTHDAATMVGFAYQRASSGLLMPGVVEVPWALSIGRAIEEILIFVRCSQEGEWEGQVVYLPL